MSASHYKYTKLQEQQQQYGAVIFNIYNYNFITIKSHMLIYQNQIWKY